MKANSYALVEQQRTKKQGLANWVSRTRRFDLAQVRYVSRELCPPNDSYNFQLAVCCVSILSITRNVAALRAARTRLKAVRPVPFHTGVQRGWCKRGLLCWNDYHAKRPLPT